MQLLFRTRYRRISPLIGGRLSFKHEISSNIQKHLVPLTTLCFVASKRVTEYTTKGV